MRQLLLLVTVASTLTAVGVRADGDGGSAGGYALDGAITSGYRNVDIDGSKSKYKEDYNLRSGLRLFDFDVNGVAKKPDDTKLDRFHLEVETPGDEPVSHYRLTAADRSLYDFRADFTRSKYFYQVPQLFEQPVAGDLRLDDLHDFDFIRTNGAVDLTLRPQGLPTLLFGYRLYERHGDGVSTARIRSGDTFAVAAPVDSTTHVGLIGTSFRALETDVFLQEEYRRVDRRHDLGPVRDPAGVDPTDTSVMTDLHARQDEHLDIPSTTVRLRRPVGDRLELTGAYFYSHADLGFGLDRSSTGTSNLPGPPPATTVAAAGGGSATMNTHVADLGATYDVTKRVRLALDYRYNERSQNGTLDETSTLGVLAAQTGDHVRLHAVTGDVEADPTDTLSLRAGARWAHRDAAFSQTGQDIATETVGAIGDVRWRPRTWADLYVRYENVQLDDPFTTPGDERLGIPEREIALTYTNRGTAGVRLTPCDWLALSYQLTSESRENSSYAATSHSYGNSVALTLTPLPDLSIFTSYTRRDLDNRADILLAPLYARTASVQNGSEDVFVSGLRWDTTRFAQRWTLGWDVAYVNADHSLRPRFEPGLAGIRAYDLERADVGAFVALHHRIIEPSIEFRWIDYGERVLSRNDYRATIVTFKLTKRWSM